MSVADLTNQLKKHLDKEKELQIQAILDIFGLLDEVQITKSILEDTKVGVVVNTYRKSDNEEISSKSKQLLKKWKKLIDEQEQSGNSNKEKEGKPKEKSKDKDKDKDKDKEKDKKNQSQSQSQDSKPSPSPPPVDSQTGASNGSDDIHPLLAQYNLKNTLRNKSMKLLLDGLLLAASDDERRQLAAALAKEIEEEVLKASGGATETDYKQKIRSLSFNLKDPKNPQLREKVFEGKMSPEFLSTASAADLANEETKMLNSQLRKKAIDETKVPESGGTRTTQFRCGKCGKSDTKYSQLQTRSADEPMTTFVTCLNCGNNWKFS
jgi:transcription elongation factor S-II